jgi:hypothetical protein
MPDFGEMTPQHVIYIPSGAVARADRGYVLGARAVRAELERKRSAARRSDNVVDFSLSDEHKALIETARRFTKERIIPIAAECDRESRFPMDVFKEAWEPRPHQPDLPGRIRRRRHGRARERDDRRGAGLRLHRHPDQLHSPTAWRSRP